jgi:hypothetical protein
MALSMRLPSVTDGDVSVQRKLVSAFRYEAAEGLLPSIIAALYVRVLSFHHMNQPHRGRHKL